VTRPLPVPTPPAPPCLSVALLGRRVELDLYGKVEHAVVVGLFRGILRLRAVGARRADGTWAGTGLSWTRPRAVVKSITVIDVDVRANPVDSTPWVPRANPWSPR